eukprot:415867-Prymnesium_polylepis.1
MVYEHENPSERALLRTRRCACAALGTRALPAPRALPASRVPSPPHAHPAAITYRRAPLRCPPAPRLPCRH